MSILYILFALLQLNFNFNIININHFPFSVDGDIGQVAIIESIRRLNWKAVQFAGMVHLDLPMYC